MTAIDNAAARQIAFAAAHSHSSANSALDAARRRLDNETEALEMVLEYAPASETETEDVIAGRHAVDAARAEVIELAL